MPIACSIAGSSTLIGWKRRDSAASFSKYFLYSAQVVAAIVRSSPRASAGFSRLAASFWPSAPPAPIIVCASSMNRMMGVGELRTSSITCFSRFSNSPFTPAPACRRPMSRLRRVTFLSGSGTSPSAMRCAKPSTTAVLPTPASPVRIGLFCRRRVRMSMIWRISKSRPRTGSILPALRVRRQIDGELVEPGGLRAGALRAGLSQLALGRAVHRCAFLVLGRAPDDLQEPQLQLFDVDVADVAVDVDQLPAQPRVGECREQQRAGAHARLLEVDRRLHPAFAREQLDGRRERRLTAVSGLQPVERLLEVAREAIRLDREVAQDARHVSGRILEELVQPVLELDLVVGARDAHPGGAFERAPAGVVQAADQRAQVETHGATSGRSGESG